MDLFARNARSFQDDSGFCEDPSFLTSALGIGGVGSISSVSFEYSRVCA